MRNDTCWVILPPTPVPLGKVRAASETPPRWRPATVSSKRECSLPSSSSSPTAHSGPQPQPARLSVLPAQRDPACHRGRLTHLALVGCQLLELPTRRCHQAGEHHETPANHLGSRPAPPCPRCRAQPRTLWSSGYTTHIPTWKPSVPLGVPRQSLSRAHPASPSPGDPHPRPPGCRDMLGSLREQVRGAGERAPWGQSPLVTTRS